MDLKLGQVDEDTDGGMDCDQILNEQAVCHLFCSWFVSSFKKPFSVGKLVQRVCVYVDHRKSIHLVPVQSLKKKQKVSMEMVVTSLAALTVSSLAGIGECPEIYWMKMKEEMELMELWIEEVREFDGMRASYDDLLSEQKV